MTSKLIDLLWCRTASAHIRTTRSDRIEAARKSKVADRPHRITIILGMSTLVMGLVALVSPWVALSFAWNQYLDKFRFRVEHSIVVKRLASDGANTTLIFLNYYRNPTESGFGVRAHFSVQSNSLKANYFEVIQLAPVLKTVLISGVTSGLTTKVSISNERLENADNGTAPLILDGSVDYGMFEDDFGRGGYAWRECYMYQQIMPCFD